jgi:two-component system chemotaxis response regulator CheY
MIPGGERILVSIFVVDDEPQIQVLYKKSLSILGFEVIGIASDGEEAVNMFKSFSAEPDIILMDHRMPKKSGIEAMREILQVSNHSKIIFASADDMIKEEALAAGAVGFKMKPFTIDSLKSDIDKISHLMINSYEK